MCTLYNITASRDEIAALFRADPGGGEVLASTEIYPRRNAYVVRQRAGARAIDVMQWGFPPPPTSKAPVVNVRNLASPFWRTALGNAERRCLVPVTRFCEWQDVGGLKSKCWFTVVDRPVFALAGIWRPIETGAAFAFLTCTPNPLVGAVHPKAMPVILPDDAHDAWLRGDPAEALAVPFPSQFMAMAR